MSKNPDNPFAALKASRFPDARKKGRAHSVPAAPERKNPSSSDEDELFMLAMSRVEKLAPREKKEKDKKRGAGNLRRDAGNTAALRGRVDQQTPSAVPPYSEARMTEESFSEDSAFSELAAEWKKNRAQSLFAPQKNPASPAGESLKAQSPPAANSGNSAPGPDRAKELADIAEADITEEDIDVFFSAMNGITPLEGKGREVRPEPLSSPAGRPAAVSNPLQDIVDGKVEFTLSGTDEFMEGHVVGLDLLTVGKLQAGQFSPEAHIDLHGLNSEQAFHNLVGFFRNAYYKGVRTALVVTGRGLNSPDGTPILRAKMRQWFTQEPFRRVILAFCTARREDGGTGALYVLLRKYRKSSGKVHWDALPADPDLFV